VVLFQESTTGKALRTGRRSGADAHHRRRQLDGRSQEVATPHKVNKPNYGSRPIPFKQMFVQSAENNAEQCEQSQKPTPDLFA
jgi:hypothetical protein